MFVRILTALVLLSWVGVDQARAEKNGKPMISAGLRENYITKYDFSYDSVQARRLIPALFADGYKSTTAAIRLSVKDETDSRVISPQYRSKWIEIESFAQRVRVADHELVFKPLISKKPGLGVAERLPYLHPKDPAIFFATYQDALGVYFNLIKDYGVNELVLGVGMGKLWGPEYAKYWLQLLKDTRRRCDMENPLSPSADTRLSIELVDETDFVALDEWKARDEKSFTVFAKGLKRIRIVGTNLKEIPGWVSRAHLLFDKKEITLSNVTFVGKESATWVQDEVLLTQADLEDTPMFNSSGRVEVGTPHSEEWQNREKRQAEKFKKWLLDFDLLPEEVRQSIVEIEFRAATTDHNPPEVRKDPRSIHYNPLTRGVLQKWKDGQPLDGVAMSPRDLSRPEPKRGLASVKETVPQKTACVFYDRNGPKDIIGAIHTPMLQSLLGAFKNWTTTRSHINEYRKEKLDQCDAVFYIASNFNLEPPSGFYSELAEYSLFKPVVWMNYKFTNYVRALEKLPAFQERGKLGFDVARTEQPLTKPEMYNLDPGYYRYFDYKGETFEKPARWNYQVGIFRNSPELNTAVITQPEKVNVIATARHSKNGTTTPYGINRNFEEGGAIWYINDLPFAFVDSGTPYFIFCDIIWDILRETPPPGPRIALVRLEDINPTLNQTDLRWAIDYLADNHIPYSLAIIPFYVNDFQNPLTMRGRGVWKPMDKSPEFMGTLRYAQKRGADFVFHGVEHKAGDLISGFDGQSAADYEFWMYPQNTPHPEDSPDYVMTKLERGEKVFRRTGITPRVWESPHYAASALDYIIFGKLFRWVYHRSIYFDSERTQDAEVPESLRMFHDLGTEAKELRRELIRQVKIEGEFHLFGGQVIPYPVYKDFYGQSVIPETLGFVDFPFYEVDPKVETRRPQDLIREAKRLKVVRGAYASFFWHVGLAGKNAPLYQLDSKIRKRDGGRNTLRQLVEGIKALGYEFRSIEDKTLFPD